MSVILRQILLFLALFITGQTWGISVAHHQFDAGNVGHVVNEYVYDATVNLQVCCGIHSQGQNANDGYLLALTGDFLATKGAGKPTIKQRYTDAVQEATKRHNGNVTVQRDGVDLFRVHQPTSGHGTNVTQIVRRPRPSDGKVFPTPRDVPVRRTHVEQLERALKGDTRYNLRTRGGQ